jgi:hypothetical protein
MAAGKDCARVHCRCWLSEFGLPCVDVMVKALTWTTCFPNIALGFHRNGAGYSKASVTDCCHSIAQAGKIAVKSHRPVGRSDAYCDRVCRIRHSCCWHGNTGGYGHPYRRSSHRNRGKRAVDRGDTQWETVYVPNGVLNTVTPIRIAHCSPTDASRRRTVRPEY